MHASRRVFQFEHGRTRPHTPISTYPSVSAAPLFQAESSEVDVVVVVHDSNGKPITNLAQEDFEIRDNGKVQNLTHFSSPANPESAQTTADSSSPPAPDTQKRFIAVFFDNANTPVEDLARALQAARQFVNQGLEHRDRVAVLTTTKNTQVTFTNDKATLLAALDSIHGQKVENSHASQCPRLTDYEAFRIAVQQDPEALDAVTQRLRNCICPPPNSMGCPSLETLQRMVKGNAEEIWESQRNLSQNTLAALGLTLRVLATMPGERMLLMISSGFLSAGLDHQMDQVIDDAVRQDVTINALSATGLDPVGDVNGRRDEGSLASRPESVGYDARHSSDRREANNESMTIFSASTGGQVFKNHNNFLQGFTEFTKREPAYVLAFSPKLLKRDGSFHRLTIKVKRSGRLSIAARPGYFADKQPTRETTPAFAASSSGPQPINSPTNPPTAFPSQIAAKQPAESSVGAAARWCRPGR